MSGNPYIPRFSLRRWETSKTRLLRVLDVEQRRFERKSAKSVFGTRGIDAGATDLWLQGHVESPINKWLTALRDDGNVSAIGADGDWTLYRAIAALCLTHVTRVGEAAEGKARFSLQSLAAAGELALDRAAKFVSTIGELFVVEVPGEDLFLTELGHFAIPRVAQRPVLAIPLSPRRLVAFGERPFAIDDVEAVSRYPRVLSALSLGEAGQARTIIVPPCYHATIDEDPEAFLRDLADTRQLGRELVGTIGEATAKARFKPMPLAI